MCNKQAITNNDIEERVKKIEQYLKSGANKIQPVQNIQNFKPEGQRFVNTINQSQNAQSNANQGGTIQEKTKPTNSEAKFSKNFANNQNSEEYWPEIVNDLRKNGKIVLYTNLLGTKAQQINDMTVGIEFPQGITSFGKTVLEKQENIKEISRLVSIACGKEMQIKYMIDQNNNQNHVMTKEENLQNFANQSDVPFNIID